MYFNPQKEPMDGSFLMHFFVYPYMAYMSWAIVHFMIIFVFTKNRIKRRGYETLYTTLLEMNPAGIVKKWMCRGEEFAPVFYMLSHMIFFLVTLLVSFLFYLNMWINFFIVLFLNLWSYWNGAKYYFDYFAKRYESSVKRLEELEKRINEEVGG